jgi:hypothetical protein
MDAFLTDSTQQVHLWTSNVVHVIDLSRPRLPEEVETRRVALCGFKPLWPGEWVQYEPNSGGNLIACRKCEIVGGASG